MKIRGGKRLGAGRPFADRVRLTIFVKREIADRWNALKGEFRLGEFLEKLFGSIKKKDES